MFKFDSTEIERNVVPAMTRATNYLSTAKDIVSAISIPVDFWEYGRLRSIPSEIDNICYRVKSTKKGITSLVNQITGIEDKNMGLLDEIGGAATGAYNFFGGMFSTAGTEAKKYLGKYKNYFKKLITNSAVNFSEFMRNVNQMAQTGGKIAIKGWNCVYKNVLKPIGGVIKATAASAGNTVISAVKGIGQLGEGIIKALALVGTGAGSVFTGIVDGVTYAAAAIGGNTSNWESITAKMWKGTMGFVSESHVENAFADFYKNNAIGKWLDENAWDFAKSDSLLMNVISGLAPAAAIVAVSFFTAGLADVAIAPGAIMGMIAGTAGVGNGTGAYWQNKRESSWENVKELYKKGEINKEQYDTLVQIRNLSASQWKEIKSDYKNGKISKEEFEQIKKIREMPDDWKTVENLVKGLGVGAATGTWEGLQYYIGGKIAGWKISGNALTNSSVRVGADTLISIADTPYRALVDSIAYGEDYQKAFEKQGGWKSVKVNGLIGFFGSAASEGLNVHKQFEKLSSVQEANDYLFGKNKGEINDKVKVKIKEGIDAIYETDVLEGLDKNTAKNVKNEIIRKYVNGDISLNDIKGFDKSYGMYMKNRTDSINNIKEHLYGKRANEISDSVKMKIENLEDVIEANQKNLIEGLDENTAKQVKNSLAEKYFKGEISLEDIGHYKDINIQALGVKKLNDYSDFLSKAQNATGTYGVDQGIFRSLKKNSVEYHNLINDLTKRYKITKQTATVITDTIENDIVGERGLTNPGVCSYADACNTLINMFKDRPQDFEKAFGFPLYEKTANGIKINQEKMLFDMYVTTNLEENGGMIFKREPDGTIVFSRKIGTHYGEYIDDEGIKHPGQKPMEYKPIFESYLKTKFENVNFKQKNLSTSTLTKTDIIYQINKSTGEGKEVSLRTETVEGPITFIYTDGSPSVVLRSGDDHACHITKVLGTTDEGVLVETWGKKALVRFEDLVGKHNGTLVVRDINVS